MNTLAATSPTTESSVDESCDLCHLNMDQGIDLYVQADLDTPHVSIPLIVRMRVNRALLLQDQSTMALVKDNNLISARARQIPWPEARRQESGQDVEANWIMDIDDSDMCLRSVDQVGSITFRVPLESILESLRTKDIPDDWTTKWFGSALMHLEEDPEELLELAVAAFPDLRPGVIQQAMDETIAAAHRASCSASSTAPVPSCSPHRARV